MELNDLLLVIIPVVCNGFLIFGFQTLVSHKIQRKEKRNELIFDIVNNLSNIVSETYEHISSLWHEGSPGYGPASLKKPIDFGKYWNSIAESSVQLDDYVQIHEYTLKKMNISVDDYVTSYENTAKFLGEIVKKELAGEEMTDSDEKTISDLVNNLLQSSITLNKQLEKILIDY